MLIFDSFPTVEKAREFADSVKLKTKLDTYIFDSQDESDKVDPFPSELVPPIVLVERTSMTRERKIEKYVRRFGGIFAGT